MQLSGKTLASLNKDDIIFSHLTTSMHNVTIDYILNSCLYEVESEMQQARGLSVTAHYAPVMCAFALLDQIGSTYSDSAKQAYPDNNASGIKKSLYYWAGYMPNGAETKALYAFRNGIDHDGSLVNQAANGDWYFFRYRKDLGKPVELASAPWDGNASTIGPATTTLIDVRALTETASAVLNAVRDCFNHRRNELAVHQSGRDILHKYIFWRKRT